METETVDNTMNLKGAEKWGLMLEELFETVEVIGVEKTLKSLQEARSSLNNQRVDIEFILDMVSQLTEVSKERILYSHDKSDERKLAMAVSVYVMRSEFNYSFQQLKKIFNRDKSALCRYNDMAENLPKEPKTDFDKKLDKIVKKMKLLLTEKKLQHG